MKKHWILFGLIFISSFTYAQSIDKSQYTEIDLFNFLVRGDQKGNNETFKFKMVLKFQSQSGTTVYFKDDAGDSLSLDTTRRWTFKKDQVVTVYFSAKHSSVALWMDRKLDDMETSTTSSVKPWLPYVSNGKTGLHGWYLQDLGNGTYKEVYFE